MPLKAYREKYSKIITRLITKCYVGVPHPNSDVMEFHGLWDTGATCSVISKRVATLLQLVPISKTTIAHAGGQDIVNMYNVAIVLPNNILFPFVEVVECPLSGFDLLIGMDIITQGNFSISNENGKTTFCFKFLS